MFDDLDHIYPMSEMTCILCNRTQDEIYFSDLHNEHCEVKLAAREEGLALVKAVQEQIDKYRLCGIEVNLPHKLRKFRNTNDDWSCDYSEPIPLSEHSEKKKERIQKQIRQAQEKMRGAADRVRAKWFGENEDKNEDTKNDKDEKKDNTRKKLYDERRRQSKLD